MGERASQRNPPSFISLYQTLLCSCGHRPPSSAAPSYEYSHQRDLEVSDSIRVMGNNTFLCAMQHAVSMHRQGRVRMAGTSPNHCNDQPDPLPRAAGSRSPAHSSPCAWTGPAQCLLEPPGFALQRGAVPLKMLR